MSDTPSILFITRTYPPVRGGMEQLSYDLTTEIGKITETRVIANRHGKIYLPIFFITATIRGLFNARKYDVVHIGDPVLCGIGWLIKKISRTPVVIEVHGLDILYQSNVYQWYLKRFFSGADLYVCISKYVAGLVNEKFPDLKTTVITPGLRDVFFQPNLRRENLENLLKTKVSDKKVLLTVGRLVKRKGVEWFIANVLPKLPENIIYVVAGNGPEKGNIVKAINNSNQETKVILLNKATRNEVKLLYNSTDIFIMPNIRITNDAEGFGLVALEAASCGLPVIASGLEGITDAVNDDQNGYVVKTAVVPDFSTKIHHVLEEKDGNKQFGLRARTYTLTNFSWPKIAEQYLIAFDGLVNKLN